MLLNSLKFNGYKPKSKKFLETHLWAVTVLEGEFSCISTKNLQNIATWFFLAFWSSEKHMKGVQLKKYKQLRKPESQWRLICLWNTVKIQKSILKQKDKSQGWPYSYVLLHANRNLSMILFLWQEVIYFSRHKYKNNSQY